MYDARYIKAHEYKVWSHTRSFSHSTGSGTQMALAWFRREFLAPRRLVFNVLFYGIQLFLFALGWYLQVHCLPFSLSPAYPPPGNKQETSVPKCSQVVRMDFQRRWSHPRLRRRSPSRPYATRRHYRPPPKISPILSCRRKHLVSPSNRLLYGILVCRTRNCSLYQLLQHRAHP